MTSREGKRISCLDIAISELSSKSTKQKWASSAAVIFKNEDERAFPIKYRRRCLSTMMPMLCVWRGLMMSQRHMCRMISAWDSKKCEVEALMMFSSEEIMRDVFYTWGNEGRTPILTYFSLSTCQSASVAWVNYMILSWAGGNSILFNYWPGRASGRLAIINDDWNMSEDGKLK